MENVDKKLDNLDTNIKPAVEKIVKASKRKRAAKPRLTKAQKEVHQDELNEYRSEVQKYITTGVSSTLSSADKLSLFESRENYRIAHLPWYHREWLNVKSMWSK